MRARKLLSAAAALALVFADRADEDNNDDSFKVQASSTASASIDLCCLQAKDVHDAEGRKKKELLVFWASAGVQPKFNPANCLVTSTIESVSDQAQSAAGKQVWPLVKPVEETTPIPGEEKCVRMMERYQGYHDEIIKQAEAEKVVNDAFRANEEQKFTNQYNAQMKEIHDAYKTNVMKAATESQTKSKELIQAFVAKVKEDGNQFKNDMRADLDVSSAVDGLEAQRQSTSESISKVVSQMAIDHNTALTQEVEQKMKDVKTMTEAFKAQLTKHNAERTEAEGKWNEEFKKRQAALMAQEKEESDVINTLQVEREKTLQVESPEICKQHECCCTIKFDERDGQAVDAKVPKNFLSWDLCQFAGKAPTKLWMSQCSSYMTDCETCKQREQCSTGLVQGCAQTAERKNPDAEVPSRSGGALLPQSEKGALSTPE